MEEPSHTIPLADEGTPVDISDDDRRQRYGEWLDMKDDRIRYSGWLLQMRHIVKFAKHPEEHTCTTQCADGIRLWQHILQCESTTHTHTHTHTHTPCDVRGCSGTKTLFHHYKTCTDAECDVCSRVRINDARNNVLRAAIAPLALVPVPASLPSLAPASGPAPALVPLDIIQRFLHRKSSPKSALLLELHHVLVETNSYTQKHNSVCVAMGQLWQHIQHCRATRCEFPHCSFSMEVLKHHRTCDVATCGVCSPVNAEHVDDKRDVLRVAIDHLPSAVAHAAASVLGNMPNTSRYDDDAQSDTARLKRQHPPGGEDAYDGEDACSVCLSKQASIMFAPCGHLAMCKECYKKVRVGNKEVRPRVSTAHASSLAPNTRTFQCPICRSKIDGAVDMGLTHVSRQLKSRRWEA